MRNLYKIYGAIVYGMIVGIIAYTLTNKDVVFEDDRPTQPTIVNSIQPTEYDSLRYSVNKLRYDIDRKVASHYQLKINQLK